jgi:hypothetical protein
MGRWSYVEHSRTPDGCVTFAASLLTNLDAFSTEHRRCGDLDAGVGWPIVWIACPCGASMARRADEDDALATND